MVQFPDIADSPIIGADLSGFLHRLPRLFRRHKLVQLLLALRLVTRQQKVSFNGVGRLYADLKDADARNIFLKESFEPDFFSIALPLAARGGPVFDVGANFGFCGFGLAAIVARPDFQLHLFEASASLCQILQRSATLYPGRQIKVVHGCVSDTPGSSRFESRESHRGQGRVSETGGERAVHILLDQYLAEQKLERVCFTKIDVEGHEMRVLRGAQRALARGCLETIYFEASAKNWAGQRFALGDGIALLRQHGYTVYFCKPADLAGRPNVLTIHINGKQLKVAKLDDFEFPPDFHSDLLAVHAKSVRISY